MIFGKLVEDVYVKCFSYLPLATNRKGLMNSKRHAITSSPATHLFFAPATDCEKDT
jgi:hypothetical protein